ncbi:MAG: nucleoside hydrolase, partial [Candidatus Ratteibacteria bacterium]
MKEKVILDTDIGTDIDDAICLAYLLLHPQCELLGITTVTGEPEKRAMIASYLCEKTGKNIPVFPGIAEPFIGQQKQKIAQQYEFLERTSYRKIFTGEWFNFLRDIIRKNPGEINLITIGPLTNIGIVFKIDPQLPRLLKSMYIMGGMFFGENKKLEWNISCDPFAAHTVFSSDVKKIFVCGL